MNSSAFIDQSNSSEFIDQSNDSVSEFVNLSCKFYFLEFLYVFLLLCGFFSILHNTNSFYKIIIFPIPSIKGDEYLIDQKDKIILNNIGWRSSVGSAFRRLRITYYSIGTLLSLAVALGLLVGSVENACWLSSRISCFALIQWYLVLRSFPTR